ncbi:hypothetical protein SRB5_01600 [Streptomyces sp. RB5]|uniref:Aminoglycoside phosphotransferase domain-containing protein n=1 Tax=Streptomyces smaragdinus TaxID=2585196 RepID=A0A7K0C9I5_9ACTN|nr:phosphotransferase [Streptomyces smaragdinus]MQY10056.1 hypothetical protein [Streptomyces smaragdinus]
MPQEQELHGGHINAPVLVDGTVRRTPTPRSPYIRRLLDHYAAHRWPGAPRHLGTDARGRETLTFIRGLVPWEYDERVAADDSLTALTRLVRTAHDLTAGHELAGSGEVVCHNDLTYRNTVYHDRSGQLLPTALIDWDLAAPGRRIHDIAHLCWQFLHLGPTCDPHWAAHRIRHVADAYGLPREDRADLVPTVLWWQNRSREGIEQGAASGNPALTDLCRRGVPQHIRAAQEWTTTHSEELSALL